VSEKRGETYEEGFNMDYPRRGAEVVCACKVSQCPREQIATLQRNTKTKVCFTTIAWKFLCVKKILPEKS
jgi:hypothetical protein